MKFSAVAVLAAVAGASAWENVTYTTEIVTAVTTYCPAATEITHGGKTYTITEATTLTITDCPCTITKPVSVISSVYCKTCPTSTPSYQNTTICTTTTSKGSSIGTAAPTTTTSKPTTIATAGAVKAAGLSGAAGVLGLAALFL